MTVEQMRTRLRSARASSAGAILNIIRNKQTISKQVQECDHQEIRSISTLLEP